MDPTTESLAETPDHSGAFPRLNEQQIAALERHGARRATEEGEILFREGDTDYDFFVVLDGKVRTTAASEDGARQIAVHGPGRFLGELGLLLGGASFITATVAEAGEVLAVPVERLREVATHDPELGDVILRAYLARRSILVELGAGLRIVGSRYQPETRELHRFAARNSIPHTWIDLEGDPEAERLLAELGVSPQETPVVIWREEVLRNPSITDLAAELGLRTPSSGEQVCDLVVVGCGPAGLAAAVYGASEGLDTVAVDKVATGGQAAASSRIENYLGFPTGISGKELADRAAIQAQKFGARLAVPAEAVELAEDDGHHVIRLGDDDPVLCHTVVIAAGASYRTLPVSGLDDFEESCVYYAATQVEAQICGGDPVVVVGGGNSAGQAALFLSEVASQVTLVVREGELTENMSRYLADRIERSPIEVMLNTEVREVVGGERLESVVVENNLTGERGKVPARRLFVFIGAAPHTSWLEGQLALDDGGYILTGSDAGRSLQLESSRPGVFAAGDVRSGSVKRVASAVGEGSIAIWLVHQHLAHHHSRERQPAPV